MGESAHHKQNMALIGYSGLGLAGYGWSGLGAWAAPLAIHRDGPFLCGNGEHLINGLCKKKRSLRLTLRPMPTTVLAMEATAMEVLATDTARGLLMLSLRPMPGLADMDLASGASLLLA